MACGLIFIFRILRTVLGSGVTVTANSGFPIPHPLLDRPEAGKTKSCWLFRPGEGVFWVEERLSAEGFVLTGNADTFKAALTFQSPSTPPPYFSRLPFFLWRIYWFFLYPFSNWVQFFFFSGWHFCKFIIWSCIYLASELRAYSLGLLGESGSCIFLYNYSMTFTLKVYCFCFANTVSH